MPLDNKYLAKMRALNGGGTGGTSTPTWDNILNKPDVVLSVNGSTPDEDGNVEVQGGGVTSWNDLTDKPFYEEVGQKHFVDNETHTSELDSTFGVYVYALRMRLLGMHLTEPCTVTWDGVERTHNPVALSLMGINFTAYGNVGLLAAFGASAEDTGEPYVLMYLENGYTIIFPTDTEPTEHTFSIIGTATLYHTMEQAYVGFPCFDLGAMGLPAIENITGYTQSTEVNTLEILNAFNQGIVKLKVPFADDVITALVLASSDGERYRVMIPAPASTGSQFIGLSFVSGRIDVNVTY